MTVQVTFEVDEAGKARLEASAARRGESLSEYIAQSMTEVMDMEPTLAELVAEAEADFHNGDIFSHDEVLEHVRQRREGIKATLA